MKRTAVFALMIALSLLSGCGQKAEEKAFMDFQSAVSGAAGIEFTADVRAEYDDKTEEYTLKLSKDANGVSVEVVKPDIIAGIKAHIDADSSTLEYDGASLDTGKLADNGLTPISALPELVSALSSGHLDIAWSEGYATVAQITPKDDLTVTVWFDENMLPFHAELQSGGKVLAYCDIMTADWSVK